MNSERLRALKREVEKAETVVLVFLAANILGGLLWNLGRAVRRVIDGSEALK